MVHDDRQSQLPSDPDLPPEHVPLFGARAQVVVVVEPHFADGEEARAAREGGEPLLPAELSE